jgi:hypothetical protein
MKRKFNNWVKSRALYAGKNGFGQSGKGSNKPGLIKTAYFAIFWPNNI